MNKLKNIYKTVQGKTYSLYEESEATDKYYSLIRKLTDLLLKRCPDKKELLCQIRREGGKKPLIDSLAGKRIDKPLVRLIKETLKESLSVYTTGVKQHLKTVPISQRLDPIIKTEEHQYHLYMIEIELMNRINKTAFGKSEYKFSLIAHCLRDFRPDCRSESGDFEAECKSCTKDCFINLGSLLLKKYGIHPYISVTMELEQLFEKIKSGHKSVGALGIACIPELAQGMRLCSKLDIPSVGIPLDANLCSRWMGKCRESSFNLEELEKLIN